MLLISHRGNQNSIIPDKENSPLYIDEAINKGFDVEIDVRVIQNKIFLGHDAPDYEIPLSWLSDRKYNLWIHTKNFAALSFLIDFDFKIFYHQKENHTIINNCGVIWSHDLSEANEKSIIPLLSLEDIKNCKNFNVFGICSDFVESLK